MGNVVFIDPGNRGARFHFQFMRPKGEVADFDRDLVCGTRHRYPNEHGCNADNAVRHESCFGHAAYPCSALSMIARRCSFFLNVTLAMPSMLRSLSSATFIGPGEGAEPGAGCGKAVERAVWKVTLPSTFCMTWWIWPFSTVTEPKPLTYSSARAPSSVPQPHCGYTVHSGMCANSTIGVDFERPLRSASSHSSCSLPRLPRPPALRSTTLTRPMKCTPPASNEYQPAPLVPRP